MGTIKNYLGITQTDSFGTSFTIDDKGEGLSLLSSLDNFHKNLVPAPNENDLFIAGPNLIFSFSLSRTTAEALISRYKQVNYSLTITGTNYKQVQETILVSKLHTTGINESAIKWDGSYGILRIGIPLSNTIADSSVTVGEKLFNFNSISAIGITIISEGDTNNSSGMAHIFSLGKQNINDADDIFRKLTSGISSFSFDYSTSNLTYLSTIVNYSNSPASQQKPINNEIVVLPYYNTIGYTLKGLGDNNYTNNSFFNDKVQFDLPQITHSNFTLNPSYYQFCTYEEYLKYNDGKTGKLMPDNWVSLGSPYSFTINDFKDIYNSKFEADEKKKFIGIVYGGYTYLTMDYLNTLSYCREVIDIQNESGLSKFYTVSGDRKRNIFVGYVDVQGNTTPDVIKYKACDVSDLTFTFKGDATHFPYNNLLKDGKLEVDAYVAYSYLTSNSKVGDANFVWLQRFGHNVTSKGVTNRFNTNVQENWFNFPFKDNDDVRYWKVGEALKIDDNFLQADEQQEIIIYNDEEFEFTPGCFIDSYELDYSKAKTTKETAQIHSQVPLTLPKLTDHQNLSDEEKQQAYFEYIFFSDIEEGYRHYYNNSHYTILHSNLPQKENIDLHSDYFQNQSVKFQEDKLYFTFKIPIGDNNAKYGGNQFINYAISGDHAIGLSTLSRIERMELTIKNENEIEVFKATFGDKQPSNLFSWKTWLEVFLTGKQNILDFSKFTVFVTQGYPLSDQKELYFTFTFYTKRNGVDKKLFTINNTTAITPVIGIRPFGLRKNGIIINPIEPNEDLIIENTEEKIAQRINAKTYKYDTNTIRGTILQSRAITEEGASFEKSLKSLIEYEEQLNGRSDFDGSGRYLFDGINLPELKNQSDTNKTNIDTLNTTIGDENSGLTHTVNDNYYAINSQIKPYLETISINYQDSASTLYNAGDGKIETDKTINFTINNDSICFPVLLFKYTNGSDEKKAEGSINLKGMYISGTTCSVTYHVSYPSQSALAGNHAKFEVAVRLLSINIPNFTTAAAAALTFNSPSPTVTETTEEEAVEEVIEETPTEQTEVVEPETTTDGSETTE